MGSGEGNPLGGANPHGLYVPITPDEQDGIERAKERGVVVKVSGLGVFPSTHVTIGDHRVSVGFTVSVKEPRSLTQFSHSVETEDGIVLAAETISCIQMGQPMRLLPGEEVEMEIHISVARIDPKVLRQLRPGVTGLTSRRVDRDTGEFSFAGNMQLTDDQRKLLTLLPETPRGK